MKDFLNDRSHRRYNILTGEWVQVSPHRTKRPWQGQVEKTNVERRPYYDPKCYLCPGNERAGGEKNSHYTSTYSFVNDFAAIPPDGENEIFENGLLKAKSEKGICKVICFSPRHNLTLPELSLQEIENVIELWITQFDELSKLDFINHVQIFENKGAVMGCSNPHPHGQIWAQESIPVEVEKKSKNQLDYYNSTDSNLLEDYISQELTLDKRILFENENFVVLIPFWAVWPFEAMIAPKKAAQNISDLSSDEKSDFAMALRWLTIRYDNLFEASFPYSAGIHQAPCDGNDHKEWHWHMTFYPPLLRSATVKKFMVGYEMFANPQRDITPEQAVERLKALPDVHYNNN